MRRMLIVEDDEALVLVLRDGFEAEGYSVVVAKDGPSGLQLALNTRLDLVVLDVMLPGLSGLEVCNQIRKAGNQVPIIFLSIRGEESDKVLGLKLGADDYVTKPFSFMELASRVEAILRRATKQSGATEGYRFEDIVVDFKSREVTKGGKPVELSAREFNILGYLVEHRGQVVTRNELLDAVWGYHSYPFTRTVDVHMGKLRKKIEDDPDAPRHLITVHRIGYKLIG